MAYSDLTTNDWDRLKVFCKRTNFTSLLLTIILVSVIYFIFFLISGKQNYEALAAFIIGFASCYGAQLRIASIIKKLLKDSK